MCNTAVAWQKAFHMFYFSCCGMREINLERAKCVYIDLKKKLSLRLKFTSRFLTM
jgi:hypothetical protein